MELGSPVSLDPSSSGVSVMPFGCEPIYRYLPPLAIFLGLVPRPKTRSCAIRPSPEPKGH